MRDNDDDFLIALEIYGLEFIKIDFTSGQLVNAPKSYVERTLPENQS